MAEYLPIYFAPDVDSAWSVSPGALVAMNTLAPLKNGAYGSVNVANLFAGSITGSDISDAYIFRKVAGTARLLCFRSTDIDEYDSAGARTNRATGLTASTEWAAAAWGDQIIAVALTNATQSSTGAGFTALGGSSPKARHIAANLNFVMVADVDDSGSNVYKDMVWWSALQNPNDWVPAIRTQAGRQRLLDAPGPITALIAYRDFFVAFKDNAIFLGEYVGPQQFIFNWRMISNRVGCMGRNAVAELGGKLYFLHSSGFYEFDGQSVRDIGEAVADSFLQEAGYVQGTSSFTDPLAGGTADTAARTQAVTDDIEGVVWFKCGSAAAGTSYRVDFMYGYNPTARKWSRTSISINTTSTGTASAMVKTTFSDTQAFLADATGRLLMVWNNSAATSTVQSIRYPVASNLPTSPTFTTGIIGRNDQASKITRVNLRHLRGSTTWDSAIAGTATTYRQEDGNQTSATTTLVSNAEFNSVDGVTGLRFHSIYITYPTLYKLILGGVAIEEFPGGKR